MLHIAGEIDIANIHHVATVFDQAMAIGTATLVVDVDRLTFCDVAGLRLLTASAERLRGEGRELVLRRASRFLLRLLALAGAESAIAVEPTTIGTAARSTDHV